MTRPVTPLLDLAAGRPVAPDPRLVTSAVEHGLGGLLLSAVERGSTVLDPRELVPVSALDATVVDHHQRLWRTLDTVVSVLDEAGIDVYTVKGVTNEHRWYGRIGERPCSDLDLVLAHHDLDRVDDVLGLLDPGHPARGSAVELLRRRRLQHVHFTLDGMAIDLHFDPLKLGLWSRRPEELWRTVTTVTSPAGRSIPVLDPAMALALALVHLNTDRFAYLGSYAEVARILDDPALDWDAFNRFVTDEGLRVPVWSTLAAVVDRLEITPAVPIDTSATTGWRAGVWRRLWPPESRLLGHEGRRGHRYRQAFIPVVAEFRAREVLTELRRRVVPPRQLLDLHRPELSDHGYMRRVTIDRLKSGRTG